MTKTIIGLKELKKAVALIEAKERGVFAIFELQEPIMLKGDVNLYRNCILLGVK
jgi:hypothetical protein